MDQSREILIITSHTTMPSLVVVTIQSAILKAAGNITAQTLSRWGTEAPAQMDWARVVEFAVFGLVSVPLVSFGKMFWRKLFQLRMALLGQTPTFNLLRERPTNNIGSTGAMFL
ncbi:unnamed protein product [Penicillium pancosmium]